MDGHTTTTDAEHAQPRVVDFLLALAVLSGAIAWGVPRTLSAFAESRISAMLQFVADAKAGVARYQADVGLPLPLDPAGVSVPQPPDGSATGWSFGWVLTRSVPPSPRGNWDRFQGPYLRSARLESPPIGSDLRIGAGWTGLGTRQIPAPPSFDLAGMGASTIPAGKAVAWMVLSGVTRSDFEILDSRLDGAMGGRFDRKCRQGELQWSPEDGGTLRIHLAHQ